MRHQGKRSLEDTSSGFRVQPDRRCTSRRRFGVAITTVGQPVKVRWLPFQLNPTMPKEGISRRDYRIRKFGSWERSLELDAQVAAAGKAEGIDFNFDKMERTPNTLDAHRLIWLADKQGQGLESRRQESGDDRKLGGRWHILVAGLSR